MHLRSNYRRSHRQRNSRWRSLLGTTGAALAWGGFLGSAIATLPTPSKIQPFAGEHPSGQTKFISDIPGGGLSSGDRRGSCPSNVWRSSTPVQIAVPNQEIGKTASERPTVLVRVQSKPPAEDEQIVINFAVAEIDPEVPDQGGPYDGVLNLIYVLEDQDVETYGDWYQWQLPEAAPALEAGSRYRFFVTATCFVKSAADDRSDSHTAIADLRKVKPEAKSAAQLALNRLGDATEENWSDRLSVLTRHELWFEYLTELQAAAAANYPEAYSQWTTAMEEVGLSVPPLPAPPEPEQAPTPESPATNPTQG
ncbi:MAG: DUF928 domain-containing protein [Cyanobacteria bacterium P01_F01_bin.153]